MHSDHFLDGRLKLRQLVVIVAIADKGSLVRAAEALHASQPILSRTLKDLETLVGGALFVRLPNGVVPTPLGELFIGHARAIIDAVRHAGQEIASYTQSQTPTVRMGAHLAGSSVLVPKAISRLKENHPEVVVIVREGSTDELTSALLRRELDVVVGRLPDETPPGLAQQTLYHEAVVFAARREHPASTLPELKLEDLLGYTWIFPLEDSEYRSDLEHLFEVGGLPLPKNRIECTSLLTLRTLLLDGDRIAALPASIVRTDHTLAILPVTLRAVRLAIGVMMRAEAVRDQAVAALVTDLMHVATALEHDPK